MSDSENKYEKYIPSIKPPVDSSEYKEVVFDPNQFTYKPDDKVAIIDGDGSPNFPNLALQKISAFEKRNGVKEVKIIKLKHKRTKNILRIHPESLKEIEELVEYDRVYASFIFTRSKAVAEHLKVVLPQAYIGGTGVDEYHDMQEGDLRARPKRITQLHYDVENMYPDHNIYESEQADLNVEFWSNPNNFKVPKKFKNRISEYGILPSNGTWGETTKPIATSNGVVERFKNALNTCGVINPNEYRGSTRGNGYSSKGCPRKCTFCVVPVIQGDIDPMYYGLLGVINWVLPRNFHPTMDEIVELYKANVLKMRPHIFWKTKKDKKTNETHIVVDRISPFLTISDNNFPADPTCLEKMDYMIQNDIAANLNQGMDARLLTAKERYDKNGVRYPSGDEICERLSKLHFINFNGTLRQMHFSWDFLGVGRVVINGLKKLVEQYGLSYSNFTVYCLSGFNTTFEEDYQRVMTLKKLKADPYVMLFRNVDGSEGSKFDGTPQDWRMKHLARWTNNKILFRATPFEKYDQYLKELKRRNEGNVDEDIEEMARLECFDWLTTDYINHA